MVSFVGVGTRVLGGKVSELLGDGDGCGHLGPLGVPVVVEGGRRGLGAGLRAEVGSGEDCAASAMSRFDWDDRAGREVLVDSRAENARGALAALGDGESDGEVVVAGELSARVVGGDVDVGDDGVLRVAWRVVPDRVMWTVGGVLPRAEDLCWRLRGSCRGRP
jgi:hypothetical protein